ncbi:hypothetical protein [Halobacteriovorax sp. DA5]|uniref:hypothetical protein n=1 Tax=Halobacteriovorax sp. DA5 TaxID=2067553 RepID=UPI000CCFF7DC|nr:hypothetical protein [Halobacteriovorax sp. DA5]POB14598.1 hypothetical protein C0Z22_05750 [Halobacteriovorax sp. DA5]
MLDVLMSNLDEKILKVVDIKSLSQKQLSTLHSLIQGENNNLLNRTFFYLLSAKLHGEDFSKEIEVDINSSSQDPYHGLISSLIINSNEQRQIEINGKLSKKESLLLDALKEAKYDRQQLIIIIYGDNCDYLKAETSFKSLLYRFKKKIKGEIIVSVEGVYSISV